MIPLCITEFSPAAAENNLIPNRYCLIIAGHELNRRTIITIQRHTPAHIFELFHLPGWFSQHYKIVIESVAKHVEPGRNGSEAFAIE